MCFYYYYYFKKFHSEKDDVVENLVNLGFLFIHLLLYCMTTGKKKNFVIFLPLSFCI